MQRLDFSQIIVAFGQVQNTWATLYLLSSLSSLTASRSGSHAHSQPLPTHFELGGLRSGGLGLTQMSSLGFHPLHQPGARGSNNMNRENVDAGNTSLGNKDGSTPGTKPIASPPGSSTARVASGRGERGGNSSSSAVHSSEVSEQVRPPLLTGQQKNLSASLPVK